ncbi:MAG: hypothetical protein FWD58_04285 [Firmicutes bacterium]|nr:hypothetical protein [Bacillota bacterium]
MRFIPLGIAGILVFAFIILYIRECGFRKNFDADGVRKFYAALPFWYFWLGFIAVFGFGIPLGIFMATEYKTGWTGVFTAMYCTFMPFILTGCFLCYAFLRVRLVVIRKELTYRPIVGPNRRYVSHDIRYFRIKSTDVIIYAFKRLFLIGKDYEGCYLLLDWLKEYDIGWTPKDSLSSEPEIVFDGELSGDTKMYLSLASRVINRKSLPNRMEDTHYSVRVEICAESILFRQVLPAVKIIEGLLINDYEFSFAEVKKLYLCDNCVLIKCGRILVPCENSLLQKGSAEEMLAMFHNIETMVLRHLGSN